ncbi:amidohydrolase [Novosphingobium album (ex Hu et al. 2023)]|uniref:Amidohydrolase n=1 Tax=Novosphingobium album (ex Hu et al. 2023) TaxID=2930093 RepID=A0ABT0B0N9_9SPHN|nr:amidohydrolase [Novosphingobium album (ex Hu et al. 2023)]MCJ2178483.1 amidohydrolase [Novosphingobium album (ex Hu et al. 2023)]
MAKKKTPPTEPAVAGTLIDNVDGLTPDGKGGIEHFDGFLIGADGHIAEVYHSGEKRPQRVDYRLDGQGRVVMPGMIDAHGHVMATGFAKMTLDLSATKSLDEALSRIAAWTAAHPDAPWILGSGWNQMLWGLGRMPTAAELDGVTGGKPAWLTRVDGHAGWANSAALKAAAITATTADPAGGEILRVAGSRKPAGVFVDAATELVANAVPRPRPEDRDTALGEAQLAFLAQGVTSIADMGTSIEDWQAFRRSADLGHLRVRIVSYAAGIENMRLIGGPRPTPWLYHDRLKMNGLKLFLDGALGSRGAWLKQPYADSAGTTGLPQMNQTQLGNLMSRAAIDNFQVAVHAIGDEANATVLNAIDELSETYTGDRRWRIEHAQIVDPDDFARFGTHGIIASMQPQHEASDRVMAEARLGPDRLTGAYAWKSLAAAGATLAFGSDTPVEPALPFEGIAVAITRQGSDGQPFAGWQPQEILSREAAINAYTTGAAYAMFAEDKLGRIAKGYDADFLFVDTDPMLATPEQIRKTRVLETWIGGQRAWAAAQDENMTAEKPGEAP